MRVIHPTWAHWSCAVLLAITTAASTASCNKAPAEAAAPAPAADTAPADVPAGMAHGDHEPHHGGAVWMFKDYHFETILDPAGHHRVYFSDAAREDLPASIASHVTISLDRPGKEKEVIEGKIDDAGESWIADGRPVPEKDVTARVAFLIRGEDEYFIDLPFSFDIPKPTE